MGNASGVAGEVEALLKAAGLKGVRLHVQGDPRDESWLFTCEELGDDGFDGVGGEVLFEADLMLDAADDYDRCVVERVGEYLIASQARIFGRDATYVGGSVSRCAMGTPKGEAFIAAALGDFSERAVGPLATLVEGAKKRGLKLSRSKVEDLLEMVRSLGESPVEA